MLVLDVSKSSVLEEQTFQKIFECIDRHQDQFVEVETTYNVNDEAHFSVFYLEATPTECLPTAQ